MCACAYDFALLRHSWQTILCWRRLYTISSFNTLGLIRDGKSQLRYVSNYRNLVLNFQLLWFFFPINRINYHFQKNVLSHTNLKRIKLKNSLKRISLYISLYSWYSWCYCPASISAKTFQSLWETSVCIYEPAGQERFQRITISPLRMTLRYATDVAFHPPTGSLKATKGSTANVYRLCASFPGHLLPCVYISNDVQCVSVKRRVCEKLEFT